MPDAFRYFVTGTDTDVGKTRVTAGLARALAARGAAPTIVKPVQTGLEPGEVGDAERAGRLAGVPALEFERFARAADPWAAAFAEERPPPTAAHLAARLDAVAGAVVVEGAGGIAGAAERGGGRSPISPPRRDCGRCWSSVCASGASITRCSASRFWRAHGVEPEAAILVARWAPVDRAYEADVRRALADRVPILGLAPYETDEAASVEYVAALAAKGGA